MNKCILLLIAVCFVGCSTGAKLRAQADAVKSLNQSIHDRAYNCAPKELAFAESNVEFGLYELSQGDFVRAKNYLALAERNAKKADKMSDFEACLDKQAPVAVITPKPLVKKPNDKDGDGIPDETDKCPLKPEDFEGFEDKDGCPDTDNDGDGIEDALDRCQFEPEDIDQFADEDGCPDLDNDGDGIADLNDQCPKKPEDYDGYQDEDGCADTDNDSDQIADIIDECPEEPETYNGNLDEDGCPDEKALAQIDGDQIKLNQKVFFKLGKANILSQSYPLLEEVAKIMEDNPTIAIRIEGHTDSQGSERYNKKLSDRRAASVRKFLVNAGVDGDRMESIGFGESRPIEDNSTDSGRAANRRVEIHITSQ